MATPPNDLLRALLRGGGDILGGSLEVMQVAVQNATAVIENLAGVAEDLISMGTTISKAVDSNQRASLSLGGTLEKNIGIFSSELKSLQGDFDTRYGTLLEVLTTGLEGQSQGLLDLVNSQKATDQNSKRTAMVFSQIQNGLNLNTEQMDELATSLFDNSRVYRVQSSRLVDSLDALAPTLDDQALLGMGPEFLGAVEMLTAEAPQSAQQITKLANLLVDISDKGYQERSRLGLLDITDSLRRSSSAEESLLLFKEAIQRIEDKREAILGDPRDTEERLLNAVKDSISNIFGPVQRLARDLEDQRDMGSLSREDVFKSFLVQLGNAFEPMQRQLFQNFQEDTIRFVQELARFAETNESFLSDVAQSVAGLLGAGVNILEQADLGSINIKDSITEALKFEIFGVEGTSIMDYVADFLGLDTAQIEGALAGTSRPSPARTDPATAMIATATAESVERETEIRDELRRISGTLEQILDRTPAAPAITRFVRGTAASVGTPGVEAMP